MITVTILLLIALIIFIIDLAKSNGTNLIALGLAVWALAEIVTRNIGRLG